jgi:hypothetical protein
MLVCSKERVVQPGESSLNVNVHVEIASAAHDDWRHSHTSFSFFSHEITFPTIEPSKSISDEPTSVLT